MSVTSFAVARGFGDRSADSAGDSRTGSTMSGVQDTSRAVSRTANPDMSGGRSSAGMSRGESAQVSAAPSPAFSQRSAPSPAATYTPSARPDTRAFSGGAVRETPPPQVRTYTAPRTVSDNSGDAFRSRTTETPRTSAVREPPTTSRTVPAYEPRTTSVGDATRSRDANARAPVPTTVVPRVMSDDSARNSGTQRGAVMPRQDTVIPANPTVTRRTPDTQRSTVTTPLTTTQNTVSDKPRITRTPAVSAPARSLDNQATVTSPTRDLTGRTAEGLNRTRNSDRAITSATSAPDATTSRNPTSRSSLPRLTTPDSSLTSANPARGNANLHFGTASDNIKSRTITQTPSALSLRSTRPGDVDRSSSRTAVTTKPSYLADGRRDPSSDRRTFNGSSSSRFSDGRSSVYHAPDRYAAMNHHNNYRGQPDNHHYQGGHHPNYHYNPYHGSYYHNAFSPVWYGPVVYPAGNSFGFSWNNGSWGLSFGYSPSCAYSTRYYDSWSCGGWGYSSVYYGGWRNNWYGGFSYVYNPWPVYRTCYLYDPEPLVVTRTETVYVTQPATTTYVVQNAEAAPVAQPSAYVVTEAQPAQPVLEAVPAAPSAESIQTVVTECLCPCHCNGQRPCTCDYPCGSEYAVANDQFNLSFAYSPYAETLNPETIWSSYAGLDRWETDTEPTLFEATVSTDRARR